VSCERSIGVSDLSVGVVPSSISGFANGEAYRAVRRGEGPRRAGLVDDAEHLGDGVVEAVVHDDVVGELKTDRFLGLGLVQAGVDSVLMVAAFTQPSLLLGARRRQDEDQDGILLQSFDLLGTVDLDLQDDVGAGSRLGKWTAVEVPQEPARFDSGPKTLRRHEDVGVLGLTGAARPGRPRT
jgi:hypothetical protein